MATDKMMIPDWSTLAKELLDKISKKLEDDCFDIVHCRAVCSSWRAKIAFPPYLARKTHSLPSFFQTQPECTLVKVPLYLCRVHTLPIAAVANCDFFLGGLVPDESDNNVEFPLTDLQSTVKLEGSQTDRDSICILDCQVLPLGDHYRLVHHVWHPSGTKGIAVVPLETEKEEDEKDFILIANFFDEFLVWKTVEKRWRRISVRPNYLCTNLVTFKGQFYATFLNGNIVVINPHSLLVTPVRTSLAKKHLVSCGDELYLVEKTAEPFRVSKLNEKTGEWVMVNDLGGRVLFINDRLGNFSCSAKKFPYDCGMSGDSILFTDEDNVTYYYKFGVRDGSIGWVPSREYRVTILPSSSVLALRVVR